MLLDCFETHGTEDQIMREFGDTCNSEIIFLTVFIKSYMQVLIKIVLARQLQWVPAKYGLLRTENKTIQSNMFLKYLFDSRI